MKIIHQNGYTVDELAMYRLTIYKNLVDCAKALVSALRQFDIQPEGSANIVRSPAFVPPPAMALTDAMQEYADFIMEFHVDPDPAVPRSRHDHSSPTGPSMTPPHPLPQKVTSSVPVEKTPKEQEKRAAVSGPESSRRKTLPIVKAKSKSTNVKAPPKSGKSVISEKYIIGKPLCSAAVLGHAGDRKSVV